MVHPTLCFEDHVRVVVEQCVQTIPKVHHFLVVVVWNNSVVVVVIMVMSMTIVIVTVTVIVAMTVTVTVMWIVGGWLSLGSVVRVGVAHGEQMKMPLRTKSRRKIRPSKILVDQILSVDGVVGRFPKTLTSP